MLSPTSPPGCPDGATKTDVIQIIPVVPSSSSYVFNFTKSSPLIQIPAVYPAVEPLVPMMRPQLLHITFILLGLTHHQSLKNRISSRK